MANAERIEINQRAIDALAREAEVRAALLDVAEPRVRRARLRAPRQTGAGAASIRAEAVLDGPMWEVRAGWDRAHYYMYFHEHGTEKLPARPFLLPAFDR